MSLILDALRKSERTRQQSLTGRLGATEAPPGPERRAVPWAALLGILLVINALALALFVWRGNVRSTARSPGPGAVPASYHPFVRPLAEEAGAASEAPAPAPPLAAAARPAQTAAPEIATMVTPPLAAPVVDQNAAVGVPSLDTLPADVRQTLPALHLDVLGYTMKPADRFVVINLQRYRIGDTTAEGMQVVDIAPGGAVLAYHGTRFLLPP